MLCCVAAAAAAAAVVVVVVVTVESYDMIGVPTSHLRMTTFHSHGQVPPVRLQAPGCLNLKN